jgi:hypothetical protein
MLGMCEREWFSEHLVLKNGYKIRGNYKYWLKEKLIIFIFYTELTFRDLKIPLFL